MQQILSIIDANSLTFIFTSLVMNLVLVILLVINYNITDNLREKYKRLVKGSSGKNIEGILVDHIERVEGIQEEFKQLNSKLDVLENRMSFSMQKVGIVRYNAFDDVGSDLSYSIALLDGNNNGIIVTGIHSRVETVSYAKPIKDGKSNYHLSVEELQALERAKSNDLDKISIKGSRSSKESE
ncbi:hypothetical protein CACET_c39360 [Clostridium aceticum]|uniref:Uncharacterized protein n=1 Tax=Clostridium aceticum TaxID=84022 RepID=A0A0D8I7X4_9CLOT|nr:DUF4446 family protein [Clostridium aceticum]AKL97362.1 hypothetical protein CACET_c39360 [Clostridium aceticum]KJF26370.1 hypothetical protein TZ02_14520 [Clostridium aceticum]